MTLNVGRFGEWLKDLLVFAIPRYIDSAFRRLDYALNAAYHPGRKRLRLKGHGPSILLLMSLSFFFALYGPTWDALTVFLPGSWGGDPQSVGILNVAMAILLLVGVVFIWLFPLFPHKGEYVRYIHVSLMLLVGAFIIVFGSRNTPEAARTLYWHGFFVFGIVALGFAWALKWFAARLFRGFIQDHGKDVQTALGKTELFVHPRRPRFHPNEIFNALISAPVYHPLPILLIPSLLVLFFREEEAMVFYGIAGLVVAWMLSFWGNLHPRWDNMMKMITRLFLVGVPLAVSLAVIAIAIARLMDVHYVTTIMDVTPMSVVPYIVAAYVFLITFEYWANRSVGEILFPMFGASKDYGLLEFSIDPDRRGDRVKVPADNRLLQLHGTDRFLVTGRLEDPDPDGRYRYGFHSYRRSELFEKLMQYFADAPETTGPVLRRLKRLTRIYFAVLNISVLVALATVYWLAASGGAEDTPLFTQDSPDNDGAVFSLADHLAEQSDEDRPAILIAASGGGTRAALYTTSVLYGLYGAGQLDNVIFGSGVSGGGASLAYFAGHRAELSVGRSATECDGFAAGYKVFGAEDGAWQCYFHALGKPFIKDVIQGVAELRIMGEEPNGRLLVESLGRAFDGARESRLGAVDQFGLLLNTGVTGHPWFYSEELRSTWSGEIDGYFSVHGGSRLVFTNLEEVNAFPGYSGMEADDILLKYKIVRDGSLPLHVGGALTANFPPVFSNARIDTWVEDRPASFLVTDGGAVENRGIISLLYGVESALNAFSKPAYRCRLPDIHVVVAEASASAIDYQNARGLETALAGSLPVAHQLYRELVDEVKAKYQSLNSACPGRDREVVVHYLPMPRVFRTRGGLGTHWMMPDTARFSNPGIADQAEALKGAIELDQASVEALLVALHSGRVACSELLTEDARPLCDWIARDPHTDRWRELLAGLR